MTAKASFMIAASRYLPRQRFKLCEEQRMSKNRPAMNHQRRRLVGMHS